MFTGQNLDKNHQEEHIAQNTFKALRTAPKQKSKKFYAKQHKNSLEHPTMS